MWREEGRASQGRLWSDFAHGDFEEPILANPTKGILLKQGGGRTVKQAENTSVVLGRLGQEDHEVEVSLGNTARSSLKTKPTSTYSDAKNFTSKNSNS